jgi:8-oxo-dGTP diphosphatase
MEENDTQDSVIVVVKEKNKLLVIRRSKTDQWMPLHWAYAGGHVQVKETPYYAAKRELLEETGLKAKSIEYKGIMNGSSHGKVYIYLCDEFEGEIKLNFEHNEHKWVTYDEIDDLDKKTPKIKMIAATALDIPLGY